MGAGRVEIGGGAVDVLDRRPLKYWTEDEVRVYLPRLRLLLGVLQRAADLGVRARTNGHSQVPGATRPAPDGGAAAGKGGAGSGDAAAVPGAEPVDPPAPPAIDARTALAEIEALDIVLRDPKRGLVDFPCLHPSGREVLLCWLSGEDDLGWWHLPEEGFAGRRPLPLPPEL